MCDRRLIFCATAIMAPADNGTGSPPASILVVSGLALANPYVGQGVYAARLVRALQRSASRDFIVVVPRGLNVAGVFPGVSFVELPRFLNLRNEMLKQVVFSERLLRFVGRKFPSAVFHSPVPLTGRTKPVRTVVTMHDCIYRRFPNYLGHRGLRRWFAYATERFAASASLVLTDSIFSKNDLVERAGIEANRIEVLYPWVGDKFQLPADADRVEGLRTRLKLPERFWLYLGGYDYRKNIEFLIESYAQARRARALPPLALAGRIPQQPSAVTCDVLGAIRKAGLQPNDILMPGLIAIDDLPDLYRAASLFVFPSLMEGFGLTPAEAVAAGTPVLVSNNSSLPEVVSNPQCRFDGMNLESLVAKLLAAAQDATQFSATLPEQFTEAYGIKHYLSLIHEVAGGRHPAHG